MPLIWGFYGVVSGDNDRVSAVIVLRFAESVMHVADISVEVNARRDFAWNSVTTPVTARWASCLLPHSIFHLKAVHSNVRRRVGPGSQVPLLIENI